jgi:hypothetical protein
MGTVLVLGMLSGIGLLRAQESGGDHDHGFVVDGAHFTCGSHWMAAYDNAAALERTRLNNPGLYARMAEQAKYGIDLPGVLAERDSNHTFFLSDPDNQGEFYEVDAVLRHVGDSILIWVDVRDTARIRAATIAALAKGLEREVPNTAHTRNPNKGVVYNDMEIFGRPPVNRYDPSYLVSFLLTDIQEPSSTFGSVIAGYFNPWDQTELLGSNMQNLLYIDGLQSLGDQSQKEIDGLIGTMAHEIQHLINYARYTGGGNDWSTHWIYNEGLSEVASLRNGYADRSASPFVATPNKYAFFTAPGNGSGAADILRAYERAMLWNHYISERFGDEVIYSMTAQNGRGVEPLQKALQSRGRTEDADDVYAEFWVANYNLNNPNVDDATFVYRFPLANQAMGRTTSISLPTSEMSKEDLLIGYGAAAYRYVNPGSSGAGVRVTFGQAGRGYAVHAIITRSDNTAEVRRLGISQEEVFEQFREIGFVLVNLSGTSNAIDWTIAPLPSGVEEYADSPALLAIAGLEPNPLSGEGRLHFTTAVSGAVSLELYDMRGRRVTTILDAVRFEAGTQTVPFVTADLDPGVYTARLSDAAGRVAVRQIVVVR